MIQIKTQFQEANTIINLVSIRKADLFERKTGFCSLTRLTLETMEKKKQIREAVVLLCMASVWRPLKNGAKQLRFMVRKTSLNSKYEL